MTASQSTGFYILEKSNISKIYSYWTGNAISIFKLRHFCRFKSSRNRFWLVICCHWCKIHKPIWYLFIHIPNIIVIYQVFLKMWPDLKSLLFQPHLGYKKQLHELQIIKTYLFLLEYLVSQRNFLSQVNSLKRCEKWQWVADCEYKHRVKKVCLAESIAVRKTKQEPKWMKTFTSYHLFPNQPNLLIDRRISFAFYNYIKWVSKYGNSYTCILLTLNFRIYVVVVFTSLKKPGTLTLLTYFWGKVSQKAATS